MLSTIIRLPPFQISCRFNSYRENKSRTIKAPFYHFIRNLKKARRLDLDSFG